MEPRTDNKKKIKSPHEGRNKDNLFILAKIYLTIQIAEDETNFSKEFYIRKIKMISTERLEFN